MIAAAAHIAERKRGYPGELVLDRHIPCPGLWTWVVIGMGGERERSDVDANATRIIDTALAHAGCRLKRSIAADVNRIADTEPLNIPTGTSAQDSVGINLIGEAETWLDVAVNGGRVVVSISSEQALITSVENAVRNVALGFAGKSAAGNHHAVQRISTGEEACRGIYRRSQGGVVV